MLKMSFLSRHGNAQYTFYLTASYRPAPQADLMTLFWKALKFLGYTNTVKNTLNRYVRISEMMIFESYKTNRLIC